MLKRRIVQALVAALTYLVSLLNKVLASQKVLAPQQKSAEESEREANERFGLSWRVAVEANNVRPWRTVPPQCYHHLQNYMCSGQYERDLNLVVEHILLYASQIPLSPDGMDAWILDVDDTCISNISYYKARRFGYVTHCLFFFLYTLITITIMMNKTCSCDPFDSAIFKAWIMKGMCPANPAVRLLFNALIERGFKLFLLTGRDQATLSAITTQNLHSQGFVGYQRLILRYSLHKTLFHQSSYFSYSYVLRRPSMKQFNTLLLTLL